MYVKCVNITSTSTIHTAATTAVAATAVAATATAVATVVAAPALLLLNKKRCSSYVVEKLRIKNYAEWFVVRKQ